MFRAQLIICLTFALWWSPLFPNVAGVADGWTPLLSACSRKNPNATWVKDLLKTDPGEDYLLQTNQFDNTALWWASFRGHIQVVEDLLKYNSNPKHIMARTWHGETALIVASRRGHEGVADLLLDYNPTERHLLAKDWYGYTALMRASLEDYSEVAEVLLKRKSDREHLLERNLKNETALELAYANGNRRVAKVLLKYFPEEQQQAIDIFGLEAWAISQDQPDDRAGGLGCLIGMFTALSKVFGH